MITTIQAQATACLVKFLLKKYPGITGIYCHDEIQDKTPGEGIVVREAIREYLSNDIQTLLKYPPKNYDHFKEENKPTIHKKSKTK